MSYRAHPHALSNRTDGSNSSHHHEWSSIWRSIPPHSPRARRSSCLPEPSPASPRTVDWGRACKDHIEQSLLFGEVRVIMHLHSARYSKPSSTCCVRKPMSGQDAGYRYDAAMVVTVGATQPSAFHGFYTWEIGQNSKQLKAMDVRI